MYMLHRARHGRRFLGASCPLQPPYRTFISSSVQKLFNRFLWQLYYVGMINHWPLVSMEWNWEVGLPWPFSDQPQPEAT